jgi:hypothetical protein
MSKIELDDQILDHPKFVRAVKIGGCETVFLWLGLRAYCSKLLTDGFVPHDMLDEVRGPKDARKRKAALAALIEVVLVEECDGGVRLHDYLDWASSRDDVLRWRERARERQARSRATSQRDNPCDSHGDDDRDNADSHTPRVRARVAPTSPSPSRDLPSEDIREPAVASGTEALDSTANPAPSAPSLSPGKISKSRSVMSACPVNFEPTEATVACASETGRDWRQDFVAMRDWALAKGERKVDWQAALRGWMRRAGGMSHSNRSMGVRAPKQPNSIGGFGDQLLAGLENGG